MIELLSKLNAKNSAFPDNQAEYGNTQQRCPECSYTAREYADPECWRCGGSRRISDTGSQKSTRAGYQDEGFTASYVASLLAGIEKHKVDAALVHVNGDMAAANRLIDHIVPKVITVAAHEWKLPDEVKSQRIAGMASTSVRNLSLYPKKIDNGMAMALVGVKSSQWKDVWKDRSEVFFVRMLGWCQDVDKHMVMSHFGPREKTG